MHAIVLLGGFFALAAGGAQAGTVITLDQSVNGGSARQQTIDLAGDKVRMISPENQMIFRGDQNKVWIVRPQDKAYVELTPESMSQMKAQMDQAMARMKQQLASMPPEQRKQMEAMMASRGMDPAGAGAAPPQITFEKAGDPKKVGDYTCTPYHVTLPGAPASEFCMAALADLGLSRDDLKPYVGFGKFMGQMGGVGAQRSPMAQLDFDAIKQQIGFDGFPVQTTFNAADGKHTIQTTLKSVKHEDPPAGAFDVPAGYSREDMGPGMSHGPRAPG